MNGHVVRVGKEKSIQSFGVEIKRKVTTCKVKELDVTIILKLD